LFQSKRIIFTLKVKDLMMYIGDGLAAQRTHVSKSKLTVAQLGFARRLKGEAKPGMLLWCAGMVNCKGLNKQETADKFGAEKVKECSGVTTSLLPMERAWRCVQSVL
jgi:hypothetical protein